MGDWKEVLSPIQEIKNDVILYSLLPAAVYKAGTITQKICVLLRNFAFHSENLCFTQKFCIQVTDSVHSIIE